MRKYIITLLIASVASSTAFAEGFSGKVSFGFLGTSGNSESTSINAASGLQWEKDRWTHNLDLAALGSQDAVDTIAEAYTIAWKSQWAIDDASYIFGTIRGEKDKFGGYDQQITEALGYGRNLIDNESALWTAEAGVGARQSDLRDGTTESETIFRGATDYTRYFSETSEFHAGFSVESGSENTTLQSILAVKAKIVGDMALVASYRIRHNTDVPAGSEETDTFTAISLEYAF
ncbi:MAG: DUF481 domain-containing protein [Pseudomonadota bacterium]